MKNVKKIVTWVIVAALVIGAASGGLWYYKSHSTSKGIDVYNASYYGSYYWGDSNYSSGCVESVKNQTIYPDSQMEIKEVLVAEGDEVKAGDVVMTYDDTELQIAYEKAQLTLQQNAADISSETAKLAHLQTLSPWVEPTPTPTPEPEPLADPTTDCYDVIDEDSEPYTEETVEGIKYLHYLCSSSCTIDPEFLESAMDEIDPFVIYMEVHEEDNDNGRILSGMCFNGEEGTITLIPEEEEEVVVVEEPVIVVPDEAYSAEELAQMISESKAKLTTLEHDKKTDELALETAEKALDTAKVTAKEDGIVTKVRTKEQSVADGVPMIVISGGTGAYVTGTISESLLETIKVGDIVACSNWEDGSSYDAEITEISPYPTEDNNYYGSSGREDSYYDFVAFIEEPGELEEGTWLDIVLSAGEQGDSFCLMNAFIGEENGQKFVWKVGEDGLLTKVTVTTGRGLDGYFTEVFGDVTEEDYVAFPGSKGLKEGSVPNYTDQ